MIDQMLDQYHDRLSQTQGELDALRTASRALSGASRSPLSVTPETMRGVCKKRGWYLVSTQPFPGEPSRLAFEIYDHNKANHGYEIPCVKIPQSPTSGDYTRRVLEWATDVATRHGDISPAEVLAEALIFST